MKPDAFDKLDRTENGAPIIRLMQDPSMGVDGGQGFLSLVDRGANGRRIQVVKQAGATGAAGDDSHTHAITKGAAATGAGGSDGHTHDLLGGDRTAVAKGHTHAMPEIAAKVEDLQAELEQVPHLGQQAKGTSWWRQMFGGLLGLREPVAKAPSQTFDEAIVIPLVWDRMWEGIWALEDTIGGILSDEEQADKQQAIDIALSQFARYVSGVFNEIPVLKADQAAAIAAISPRVRAEKAAGMIPGADPATIAVARSALAAADLALAAVVKAKADHKPDDDDEPETAAKANEEAEMNAELIAKVAIQAGTAAVQVAKAANPQLTGVELQAIGTNATQAVFKAAVMGPAQPALPADVIAKQLAEGAGVSGNMSEPMALITRALNGIQSLTAKIDGIGAAMGVDLATGKTLTLKEDASNAGLAHVITAQGKALEGLGERVQKFADTPRSSNGGGDQPAGAQELAAKRADDDVWGGSAFAFSGPDSSASNVGA